MENVVCFVGHSGSGKTSFLEKVVRELKERGCRVGVIKHTPHGFDMDRPGKDSWRLGRAGADVVAVSSPGRAALVLREDREVALEELVEMASERVDLVLIEGYKRCRWPKIVVCGRGERERLGCFAGELWAVVSDSPVGADAPRYSTSDAVGVADLVVSRLLSMALLPAIRLPDMLVGEQPVAPTLGVPVNP